MGTLAGLIAALVLVAIAGVHGVWAREHWWPVGDPDDFRETVMGPTARLPRPIESWTVAALLAVAAALTTWATVGDEPQLITIGVLVAAGVLVLRGAGGFVMSTFLQRDSRFAVLDRRIYSPLCLGLATAMLLAV